MDEKSRNPVQAFQSNAVLTDMVDARVTDLTLGIVIKFIWSALCHLCPLPRFSTLDHLFFTLGGGRERQSRIETIYLTCHTHSLSLSLSLLPAQRKFISTHDRSRLRPADFLSKLKRWVVKFHPIPLICLSRASGLRQRLFFAGQNLNRNLPSRRNNLLRTESRALQEDEICGTCLDTFWSGSLLCHRWGSD